MTDQEQLAAAIEKSNKAFEDFKTINEAKLKASQDRATEFEASLKKAFDDVEKQKGVIEKLEAKLTNRPGNGGAGGGDTDKETAHVEHRKAFAGYMRKGQEQGLDVITTKALDITNPAEGGYAVPKVIDGTIEAQVVNISPIRQIASVIQISTSDFHKLVNLRGTASGWVGEMAARPATGAPTLIDVVPPMGELYANPQATQQMLDDVFFNAEAWLTDNVATEFARAEGAAFVVGTGTTQPLGFLSSPTSAVVDDSSRPFGTLQYVPTGFAAAFPTVSATVNPSDILFTLVSMLKAFYRQNARWVVNKAVLFAIAAMKDNQGRYVFNPASAPGVPQTILNYPVTEAEDMPAMAATAIVAAFGDFKRGYLIVDRIGIRVLRDPFSNKPYIGFYTTKRVGGKVQMSEAIKLLKFSVS